MTRILLAAAVSLAALSACAPETPPATDAARAAPPVAQAAAAQAPGLRVSAPEPGVAVEPLEIVRQSGGPLRFQVEIADSAAEQERGLMFRRTMAEDRGMLFDFGGERPASFWMRNTYLPLDMIFISGDGRIESIAKNTTPMSDAPVASAGSVRAVLEINAGLSDRLGILPGDQVRHRIFP